MYTFLKHGLLNAILTLVVMLITGYFIYIVVSDSLPTTPNKLKVIAFTEDKKSCDEMIICLK